jgi:hypothetical protein
MCVRQGLWLHERTRLTLWYVSRWWRRRFPKCAPLGRLSLWGTVCQP